MESPWANGTEHATPDMPPLDLKLTAEGLQTKPSHRRNVSVTSQTSRRWTSELDTRLQSRKSLVTDEMVAAVREKLSEKENAEVDSTMLNQFLRATRHDVDKATRRLKDTVAWRLREQPHTKLCQRCLSKPRSHWLHVVGYSRLDQPIIYSCFAMAKDRDVAANREHMLVTFEQAIRAMPPNVEQWVWVCDYHGFGLRDCDPRLAKIFLDVSEKYYPERLAEFVNISTPSIFSMLWKAIEGWVDPITRAKVKFLRWLRKRKYLIWSENIPHDILHKFLFDGKRESKKNAPFGEELARICSPEMQEWMLTEMIQNRQKHAVKSKMYPYGKLHEADEAAKISILDGHDSRGTADWIQTVEEDPEILAPMKS